MVEYPGGLERRVEYLGGLESTGECLVRSGLVNLSYRSKAEDGGGLKPRVRFQFLRFYVFYGSRTRSRKY